MTTLVSQPPADPIAAPAPIEAPAPPPPGQAPAPCAVRVDNLVKRFTAGGRPVEAVRGVSFDIAEGEVFGLVGPNGAGKTTLIKMLTTLVLPTSGSAQIAGLDVVAREKRVRRLVGLVTSNERSFYWRLTGRQNLEFFTALYGQSPRKSRPWINELLDLLGMTAAADRRFEGYSTGMKQRMALARGLLNRPRVLFMDEPTKGVDPVGSQQIITLVKQHIVPRWQPTILVTSHNLSEIQRLCGRIALMHRGALVACGRLEELRERSALRDRYRLRIGGLGVAHLAAICRDARPDGEPRVWQTGAAAEVDLAFEAGTPGLPRLIRGIVKGGGDVLDCQVTNASLDDIFHHLVAAEEGGHASCLGISPA